MIDKANTRPPLSVGIINYNGREIIGQTINSILESDYPNLDLLVVDDCSTDESVSYVKERFPKVRMFVQDKNAGPNSARNTVLRESKHDLVFVTDNDITLAPDCLKLLVEAMELYPSTGVTTPMVLDSEIRNRVYSNGAELHYVCFAILPDRYRYLSDGFDSSVRKTVCGSGGIMMVRKDVAESLGGFDEDFNFGYDDGEFTFRVSASGRNVVQVPSARIYHLEKEGRNPERLRYQIKGRWNLILKAYSTRSLLLLSPALLFFELAQLVFLTVKGALPEWWRGIGMVFHDRKRIAEKRRAVQAVKVRSDSELLMPGEIFMFPTRVKGPVKIAKQALEFALDLYWEFVKRLLSG